MFIAQATGMRSVLSVPFLIILVKKLITVLSGTMRIIQRMGSILLMPF
jgi:hypothetical protein